MYQFGLKTIEKQYNCGGQFDYTGLADVKRFLLQVSINKYT